MQTVDETANLDLHRTRRWCALAMVALVGGMLMGGGPALATADPVGPAQSPVAFVELTPDFQTRSVDEVACVTISLFDQQNAPVIEPGRRVDITVTGVHSIQGFTFTGEDGTAEYCLEGDEPGLDGIRASVSGESGVATVEWVAAPGGVGAEEPDADQPAGAGDETPSASDAGPAPVATARSQSPAFTG